MRPLSLLLLALILWSFNARAQELARYENFRFAMPAGWRHKDLIEGGRNRVIVMEKEYADLKTGAFRAGRKA